MDFLTPSGVEIVESEDSSDFIDLSVVLQPEIKDQPNINSPNQQPETSDKITPPKIKEITEFELGDLVSRPGLDAYREFARGESPDRLFELSSALRTRGEFQRALLAFERVIDTSKADPNSRAEAAQGIHYLIGYGPAVVIGENNGMRAEQSADLDACRCCQHLQAEHLDPASGRPAASTNKHADQQKG